GGDGFCTASGTSFATPFVAGTVALMRQGNATLNNTETKRFLMEEAQPWGPDLYAYPQPRNYDFGSGRIQAYNATAAATGHALMAVTNPPHYNLSGTVSALHTVNWYLAPYDSTWWISTSTIVPTSSEPSGTSGILTVTLQPSLAVPNINCPTQTGISSSLNREVQLGYDSSLTCTATRFKLSLTAGATAANYWLDVSYGGPVPSNT
ncbi:MAG: S8 family serine peptidase, partial [Halobacteriales archaeon]|nr:S8 family serine peptidase [Halobacteriales archaeon]